MIKLSVSAWSCQKMMTLDKSLVLTYLATGKEVNTSRFERLQTNQMKAKVICLTVNPLIQTFQASGYWQIISLFM